MITINFYKVSPSRSLYTFRAGAVRAVAELVAQTSSPDFNSLIPSTKTSSVYFSLSPSRTGFYSIYRLVSLSFPKNIEFQRFCAGFGIDFESATDTRHHTSSSMNSAATLDGITYTASPILTAKTPLKQILLHYAANSLRSFPSVGHTVLCM